MLEPAPPRGVHTGSLTVFRSWPAFVCLVLALAACKPDVKPEPPPPRPNQSATLASLGFTKTDDGWLLNLPEPISFEFDKDGLKPNVQQSIAQTADELLKANVRKLRIEGHTDNTGPADYNVVLSKRRAHAVAHEFVAHGFSEADIAEIGLGPKNPLAPNDTREGRATNRCVVIIVPVEALEP